MIGLILFLVVLSLSWYWFLQSIILTMDDKINIYRMVEGTAHIDLVKVSFSSHLIYRYFFLDWRKLYAPEVQELIKNND